MDPMAQTITNLEASPTVSDEDAAPQSVIVESFGLCRFWCLLTLRGSVRIKTHWPCMTLQLSKFTLCDVVCKYSMCDHHSVPWWPFNPMIIYLVSVDLTGTFGLPILCCFIFYTTRDGIIPDGFI